ncbi:ATP-binding protein [Streptomyces sp. ICN988]|uniref:ATP-binding protein n=1 Tax=Streptomyces sp. ICN988 TaxID=2983765 RepID=UPI0021E385DD|nr:ATP-binding protein [Streptomyces sp. ICN988]MCV2458159.1 ATP-binding protein [Streptomyces sp. ICN988]
MIEVQDIHGAPMSDRVIGTVQLAVNELVANAYKYAPGPCLLEFEVSDGAIQVSVWDTNAALPVVPPGNPERVGGHGLEVVMGVCQSFGVCQEERGKRVRAVVALADALVGRLPRPPA